MITQPSHPRLRSGSAMRKGGKRLGRLAAALAAFTVGLLASMAAATAAVASPKPIQEGGDITPIQTSPVTRTVVVGGMPGWQIALIAAGVSVLAAAVAVALDRGRAARKADAR
jgi:hypothetical protein